MAVFQENFMVTGVYILHNFHMSHNIILLVLFKMFKNVETILSSWAVPKQAACSSGPGDYS